MEQRKRTGLIDAARGFSLLGILLANMLIFQYGIWGKDQMQFYSLSALDTTVRTILEITVEHSFLPIFTFLFGYGMIKMKEGLQAAGRKPFWALARRFLFLFVIGLLHSHFLTESDILSFYGFIGFFLLLFLNRKPRTLLIWGTSLLLLFSLLGLVPEKEKAPSSHSVKIDFAQQDYIKETIIVYGTGTYSEIKQHRQQPAPIMEEEPIAILILLLLTPLLTAPMFLFGMYAAKKSWFQKPQDEQGAYGRRALIFLAAGFCLKVLPHLFSDQAWASTGELAGANLAALGYLFSFAWLYSARISSPWMKRFEAVGKLSLTNYLMQTLVCTTIFYGYGLGWFGKLGVAAGCGLALLLYALQLFASKWYLRHFSAGPAEKLLRIWTYLSFHGKVKTRAPQLQRETLQSRPL
ncbi:DUF418 domain-containing protein [Brevibacillus ruminantium]|uniref:DUF418 domain-containing protein n=1 Tax=Brevibacillus ruminantium TaxID=2950604 RepID=A0ABY4WA70_9BACL|nr:DUF418 domain-containing protein [Brevibacillus ruminantium]USG63736.1 DUF418 domain-containing protein [Brevibacillus ruminantium]